MYSVKRRLFPIIFVLCVGLLTGCMELLTKPAVPFDVSLAPAVIYVPACNKPETGVFGFLGSADRSWGEGLCANLSEALKTRISTENGRYALVNIASKEERQEFSPDLAVEKSIGARYRVILREPVSGRTSASVSNGYTESVTAYMTLRIIDVKTNSQLADAGMIPNGKGVKGASDLADKLVRGLNGPRCKPQTSISFRPNAGCETFRLPATH
jgi:hypothetical protein